MATVCRTERANNRLEQTRRWAASADGRQAASLLLAWFDRCGRALPWRLSKDPYRVWLSEIMLQQTQVATVIPYFERFLRIWPTVADLAGASDDAVLKMWEGLGYYSRARHLLAAARLVVEQFGGVLPQHEDALRRLPGVGQYTACAILSIAHRQPVAAVDGNVVRVFARLAAVGWLAGDPAQRQEVRQLAESLLPRERPGDWNEALMDLGATVCLPRAPRCGECPLQAICLAYRAGQVLDYPLKPAKKTVPVDHLTVVAVCRGGRVFVRQREKSGLLGGLFEFSWLPGEAAELDTDGIAGSQLTPLVGYNHAFTHRRWQLAGYVLELPVDAALPATLDKPGGLLDAPDDQEPGFWVDAAGLAALAFPTALAPFREQVVAYLNAKSGSVADR